MKNGRRERKRKKERNENTLGLGASDVAWWECAPFGCVAPDLLFRKNKQLPWVVEAQLGNYTRN